MLITSFAFCAYVNICDEICDFSRTICAEYVCLREIFFGTSSAWSCTSITYMRFSNRRYIREKRQKGGAILTNDVGLRSRCNVVCVWQRDWQHGCVWPRRRCVWILFSIIYTTAVIFRCYKQVFLKAKMVWLVLRKEIYMSIERNSDDDAQDSEKFKITGEKERERKREKERKKNMYSIASVFGTLRFFFSWTQELHCKETGKRANID